MEKFNDLLEKDIKYIFKCLDIRYELKNPELCNSIWVEFPFISSESNTIVFYDNPKEDGRIFNLAKNETYKIKNNHNLYDVLKLCMPLY